jgi:hypothetical protein
LGPDDLRNYKLGFIGELSDIAFQKQPGRRDVTLMFLGPDNYWEFIKQHYINFSNGGIELLELAFLGVKASQAKSFDVAGKDLQSNLYTWLTASKSKTGKPSIYLGVHRVLREMWFAANDWYGRAYNRWRVGDLIVGLPEDETAAKLFRMDFFEKFITNQIGGRGGQYNLDQMIRMLLGMVYHTTVSVPFPRLDPKGEVRGYDKKSGAQFLKRCITRDAGWADATLNYTVVKPDSTFLAPPVCNIVFPGQYATMSHNRSYLTEPTRLFFRTSLMFTGQDKWLTERFYAPDFKSIAGLAQGGSSFRERMATTVLPHEQFTGLNPIEQWADDLTAYVAKGPRRNYLAAVADYQFWKSRFGPRTMTMTGPLNMNLIAGWPGLALADQYSSDHMAKHVVGQVNTVVHSIDQNGGFTQSTWTHVRHHTELVDFDAKSPGDSSDGTGDGYRSLEKITSRGTDGFMDNRYDVERIGKEVYSKILGCDSLYDLGQQLALQIDATRAESRIPLVPGGTKTWADIKKDEHPLRHAIWALEILWRQASDSGGDLHDFARQISWRPKASMPEVLGVPSSTVPLQNAGDHAASEELRLDGMPAEGFLASAFDPDSFAATKGDTYQGVKAVTRTKKRIVVDSKLVPHDVDGEGSILYTPEDFTREETYTEAGQATVKASYGLSNEGKARRRSVELYVDSLRHRGLVG